MRLSKEEIIKDLSDKRYILIEKIRTADPEIFYSNILDKDIDDLAEKILSLIKEFRSSLPFEFIFEELTKLGQSPSLLYDDNGNYAMVVDGFQSVPKSEPDDMEMSFFIEKNNWKPTIREALNFYLDRED